MSTKVFVGRGRDGVPGGGGGRLAVQRNPQQAPLVCADEQRDQCARLADEWSEEDPTLVFLTRDGRLPRSAGENQGQWVPLRWSHVVGFVEGAILRLPPGREPAPGVLDLLKTLTEFHGG